MSITISEIASRHLETWLDDLQRGDLQLWELPPAVRAWYYAGFAEGTALNHQTREIERLERECDRLYLAAFTPKENRERFLKRHAERTRFEWELFENALLQVINSKRLEERPHRAEVEQQYGHSTRTRKAA